MIPIQNRFLNYFSAWIEEHNIKDYEKFKDKLKNSSKSAAFKGIFNFFYLWFPSISYLQSGSNSKIFYTWTDAVDAIEAYIADPERFDSVFQNNHRDVDAEFNKLRENDDQNTSVDEKSPSPVLTSPPSTKKTANKRKLVSKN